MLLLFTQIICVLAMVTPVLGTINLALYLPIRRKAEAKLPPVSVLIPARNEEARITPVLDCVSASTGVEFEVIVADDSSTDGTAGIVQRFANADPRIRLVTTPSLPDGWMGKNHACQFLATQARHDLMVFLDADVTLSPDALQRLASEFARRPDLKLLSGFPRQITGSFWEKLLIPLIHTVLLGYLPFPGVRFTNMPAFATACGQLIAVDKAAYLDAGGHERIRGSVHDGVMIPRHFRAAGHRTDLVDITGIAATRMYETGPQVLNGLLKNAHEGMATPVGLPVWTILLLGGHVIPVVLFVAVWLAGITGPVLTVAAWSAALPWLMRFIMAFRFRLSPLGAALHPFGILALVAIQWLAFVRYRSGRRVQWKDRPVG